MRTGAWTAACLLLAVLAKTAPALPADVFPVNNRFDIPITIDPARERDIERLELYVSADQGKTWNQKGSTTPDHKSFPYAADDQGEFWFSVIIVDKSGRREPPQPKSTPADKILKILIDTFKPIVKLHTERQGDSVSVNWEIQEEHLDPNSFRLEWRPEAGPENWVAVQVSPGQTGRASIRAEEAIVVRASVKDVADNLGKDEAKVPAAAGSVAAMGPGLSTPVAPVTSSAADLGTPPAPPIGAGSIARTGSDPAGTGAVREAAEPIRRVSTAPVKTEGPPSVAEPIGLPPTTFPAPAADRAKPDSIAETHHPVATPSPIGPPVTPIVPPVGVAPIGPPAGGIAPPVFHSAEPVAPPAAAGNSRNDLQVINTKRVTMEYEVSKVGPSGVGSVDVYLTHDDGLHWTLSKAEHQALAGDATPGIMRRTVSVELGEDGIYGFFLVAKSGAGMSKPGPRPGEAAQMRVKLDTTLPTANLFRPKKDKAHPDALFIMWAATDANLTATPVSIQWAEKPSGPWEAIGPQQMANTISDSSQIPSPAPVPSPEEPPPPTGSFTWQIPANIPANVYLRLTVRDAAGNVAIAETKEAISIDLSEPEVSIHGLVSHPH